jgi:hypothetical protein
VLVELPPACRRGEEPNHASWQEVAIRPPGFFIVGAPKCGTTALSEYLRGHPQVFMSQPKEPHYFCTDFDYYYRPGEATLEHYLELFADAGQGHDAVGEASVWYLYSQQAVPGILEFSPNARIIVMVRNPVELVPSLHSQLRYSLDEDEPDVRRAWELQGDRAAGRNVPSTCRVPQFLQYRAAASLGSQLQRLYDHASKDQVEVIVFDDLRSDARAVYTRTLDFLGIDDDGRANFPRVNANKAHRGGLLARMTQRPPAPLVVAARSVKRVTGMERLGVLSRVRSTNRVEAERAAIDAELSEELGRAFADDIGLLSELLGRDLSHWVA